MKIRNLAAAAASTLGVTAVANRLLSARAGDFDPILPGDQGTYRWRGFDVAYAELGDPADQDLVCLHGIHAAASGHEFREIASTLAADHHVLIPDLPGFGHSDRPGLFYSASLYETFVAEFIADRTDDPPVVVASSLAANYAAIAARDVELQKLVCVCPSDGAASQRRWWLRALLRSPLAGQGIFNLLASKPSIRYFHADHGMADVSRYPADLLDYEWQTAHQPGARFAPASFLAGYLDSAADLGDALADLDVPLSLVWGRDADIVPLEGGREIAEAADARLIVIDDAKLLPHVEHPEAFGDAMADAIRVPA